MAVGDIVQSDSTTASAASPSITFTSTATSGNLLVLSFFHDGSRSKTTPSGWTAAQVSPDFGGTPGGGLYYKISDGTETSVAVTLNSSSAGALAFVEIEWGQGTPTVSSNENETALSTAADPLTTGSVTPDESTNVAVAIAGDVFESPYSPAINNSFTVRESVGTYPCAAIATKLDQSGAVNPSWSGNDSNYAALAVFSYAAATQGKVWVNDAAAKDGGEVEQTYPGEANWSDTLITMQDPIDTTGLSGQLYLGVEDAAGAVAWRAITVDEVGNAVIIVPVGPVR